MSSAKFILAILAISGASAIYHEPSVGYYNLITPILDNILGNKFYMNQSFDIGYETQYDGNGDVNYFHQGYGLNIHSYFNTSFVLSTKIYYYEINLQLIPFDITPVFLAFQIGQQPGTDIIQNFGTFFYGGYSLRFLSLDTYFGQNTKVVGTSFYERIREHAFSDISNPPALTVKEFFKSGYDQRYQSLLKSKYLSFDFFKLVLAPGSWYNGAGSTVKYFNVQLF